MEDVQIIDIDGSKPVYLRKKGLKSGSQEFKELGLALNAVGKANVVLDAELIEAELGDAVCEEWGILAPKQNEAAGSNSKKENLEPFKKTHILLSFHPQLLLKIQAQLQTIIETEGVEYEQSNN
jgi:hypothetical protein